MRVIALMFPSLLALVSLAILGCAASRGTVADDDATADDDDNDDNNDDNDDDFAWSQMGGDCPALVSVWGTSHDDVFAVGWNWPANAAAVLHFDGASWSHMTSGEGKFTLWSVSGTSPSDVFAVGEGGEETVILRYDGDSWSVMPAPLDLGFALRGVWAGSVSNVYAVGFDAKNDGVVGHFDGATWSLVNGGFPSHLQCAWGTSPSDVYVSGNGTSHFDGATWSPAPGVIANAGISSFWELSPSDIFAVGGVTSACVVFYYDGSTWSVMYEEPSAVCAFGVWGASPDDVFAVGGYEDQENADHDTILHYDGLSWSIMDNGTYPFMLFSAWGSGPSDVFAVGSDYSYQAGVILHYGPLQ